MDLCQRLAGLPFAARFAYDAGRDVLYLDFERMEIKTPQAIEAIRAQANAIREPLIQQGRRVQAAVNHEGFVLDRDLEDRYAEMARDCVQRYDAGVTRYTASAFMRAKRGRGAVAAQARAPCLRKRGGGGAEPGGHAARGHGDMAASAGLG